MVNGVLGSLESKQHGLVSCSGLDSDPPKVRASMFNGLRLPGAFKCEAAYFIPRMLGRFPDGEGEKGRKGGKAAAVGEDG